MRRLRAVPAPLAALLVVATLLQVSWSLLMAPLQGPDEQNHAAYVQYLAETGKGPDFGALGNTYSKESNAFQDDADLRALVGVLGARPGWTKAEEARFEADTRHLGRHDRAGAGQDNPVAQNPPLYYVYDAIPYRIALALGGSLPTRLLWMRLANLPLLLLIVACAWGIAGELFRRRRVLAQTVAAGSVALLPQLGFMAGVVNPDIGLSAIFAALIYGSLRAIRDPAPGRWIVGLGALGGAAALTHGRGLAALVPVLVVTGVSAWRVRGLGRRWLATRLAAAYGLLGAGTLAAFAYSGAHGGTAAFGSGGGSVSLKGLLSYVWQFYLPRLDNMRPPVGPAYGYRQFYVHGFFGTFGSLEIELPPWVYAFLQVAAFLGMVAVVALLVRRWGRVSLSLDRLGVLVLFFVGMLALLHYKAYHDLQAPAHDPLLAGRYLLPMATVFSSAVAFVCVGLSRARGTVLAGSVLGVGVLLSLTSLGLTLERFYA